MLLDVELPDRLAEAAVDQRNAPLPAVALHRHVGERLAVESEARVVESLGQELRMVAEEVEGQVILPSLEWLGGDELAGVADRGGLADDDDLGRAEALLLEDSVPVELRRELGQLRARLGVVGRLDVAATLWRPVRRRHLGLKRHDPV